MKIILFANTDWYLYNFRLPLAKALKDLGHDVILLSPHGNDYSDRILRAGFDWRVIELSRTSINPINEIGTIISLISLYKKEKPDIVHHFTIKCVLYGSFAARKAGVKQIVNAVTGMGYIFTSQNIFTILAKPIVRSLYRWVLKGSSVIFQNETDLKYFVDKGLVSSNLATLIPSSGVDIKRFKPQKEEQGIPLVILPARMLWDKGVQEYVEAAELVKQSEIQARFVLVGDVDKGNPSSIPVELLQKWQEEGFIEWWGWREDMAQVYQMANVVCLPSYGEGLSKTLIEAAACGRPLVTTDIPGCREVVENGVNGLLVQKGNGIELAAALIFLLSDVELMHKMGIESRRIAVKDYSVEKVVKETLNVYNN